MTGTAAWIVQIRDRLWSECDPAAIMSSGDEAPHVVAALARGFLESGAHGLGASDVEEVVDGVVAATLGFGPLQPLLTDPSVSEVMVNGPACVFVERDGRLAPVPTGFDDDAHLLHVIDRILAPTGRRVDSASPMVDARLPDGSRVNAVVPPLAVDGPLLTIRRFVQVAESLDDLVRIGSVDPAGAWELERLMEQRANVLVSGGTSSGKTTLLAAALGGSSPDDRLIVIEDSAELPLEHPHRVRLEARPASIEGGPSTNIRDLVRNALRMRPDRLVIGEVRGAEAYDLLQALNTGHRGSWSTIHANGPEEALLRLESMVLCAGTGMPQRVVREQVARSVDAVVQLRRTTGGGRRVDRIVSVETHAGDRGIDWQLQELYGTTP